MAETYPGLPEPQPTAAPARPQRRTRALLRMLVLLMAAVLAGALVSSQWLPVLRVTGSSMAPTLHDGELIVAMKAGPVQVGDVVAFQQGERILLKRVIALAGETVNMDTEGTVYVQGNPLAEPYLAEKQVGIWTTPLPCTVPAGRVFVLGDAREISMDSRSAEIGCVAEEQILGKVVIRLWPLSVAGKIR